MNRRGFLAGLVAAGLAPSAVAKAIAELPGPTFIGVDLAAGMDATVLFVGEVGQWHGLRIIPMGAPLTRPEIHHFMQQEGIYSEFHSPDMHEHPIFMHPHDDYFKQLKGEDHG